jgi:hypothetical protein
MISRNDSFMLDTVCFRFLKPFCHDFKALSLLPRMHQFNLRVTCRVLILNQDFLHVEFRHAKKNYSKRDSEIREQISNEVEAKRLCQIFRTRKKYAYTLGRSPAPRMKHWKRNAYELVSTKQSNTRN